MARTEGILLSTYDALNVFSDFQPVSDVVEVGKVRHRLEQLDCSAELQAEDNQREVVNFLEVWQTLERGATEQGRWSDKHLRDYPVLEDFRRIRDALLDTNFSSDIPIHVLHKIFTQVRNESKGAHDRAYWQTRLEQLPDLDDEDEIVTLDEVSAAAYEWIMELLLPPPNTPTERLGSDQDGSDPEPDSEPRPLNVHFPRRGEPLRADPAEDSDDGAPARGPLRRRPGAAPFGPVAAPPPLGPAGRNGGPPRGVAPGEVARAAAVAAALQRTPSDSDESSEPNDRGRPMRADGHDDESDASSDSAESHLSAERSDLFDADGSGRPSLRRGSEEDERPVDPLEAALGALAPEMPFQFEENGARTSQLDSARSMLSVLPTATDLDTQGSIPVARGRKNPGSVEIRGTPAQRMSESFAPSSARDALPPKSDPMRVPSASERRWGVVQQRHVGDGPREGSVSIGSTTAPLSAGPDSSTSTVSTWKTAQELIDYIDHDRHKDRLHAASGMAGAARLASVLRDSLKGVLSTWRAEAVAKPPDFDIYRNLYFSQITIAKRAAAKRRAESLASTVAYAISHLHQRQLMFGWMKLTLLSSLPPRS